MLAGDCEKYRIFRLKPGKNSGRIMCREWVKIGTRQEQMGTGTECPGERGEESIGLPPGKDPEKKFAGTERK
jgi:hypothetical protein